MSTDFDKLLDDDQVTAQRRGRVVDPAADNAPEYVRDSVHMKEIISEVLERSKPPAEDLQKWAAAGHRTVVLHEGPMSIEGVVSAPERVSVNGFKWMIRRLLDKENLSTAIYAESRKQFTGRWEVAAYRITDVTEMKQDVRVSRAKMEGLTDEIVPLNANQTFDDFQSRKVGSLNIAVVWIDAVNGEPVRYDVHGKPVDAPTVVVNNVPAAAAPAQPPQVIIMQPGQNPTVEELVAMVQNKTRIETPPAAPSSASVREEAIRKAAAAAAAKKE